MKLELLELLADRLRARVPRVLLPHPRRDPLGQRARILERKQTDIRDRFKRQMEWENDEDGSKLIFKTIERMDVWVTPAAQTRRAVR